MKSILNSRIKASSISLILVLIVLLIEYNTGGVVAHHLLAREDLPAISNWWGLLTIPLLTWIVSTLVSRRKQKAAKSSQDIVLKRFLAALIFGITASLLWEFNLASVLQFWILLPILIAFFTPVHLPEFMLGFVLGMIYTFGGILPIIIGCVLLLICLIVNKIIGLLRSVVGKKETR